MHQFFSKRSVFPALLLVALLACVERTQGIDISGIVSTTMTIYDDSNLVGDVPCMVVGAPCIKIGASHICLSLNGFTITDGANPSDICLSPSFAEDGIQVQGQEDVAIVGPGLIHKFADLGISLLLSQHMRVEAVTTSDNCFSGIFLSGTTDSDIEKNISVRNSIGSLGNPCGGT